MAFSMSAKNRMVGNLVSNAELFTTTTYSLEKNLKYYFHLGSAFLGAVLSLPVCLIRIGLTVTGFADWFD